MAEETPIVLITLADVRAADVLNITTTDHNTFLQTVIDGVLAEFALLAGGRILIRADQTDYFSVYESTWRFRLRAWPVTENSEKPVKVYYDPEGVWGEDTLIDPASYALDYEEGTIELLESLEPWPRSVKVTYNGGLEVLPADAKLAVLAQIKLEYQRLKNLEYSSVSLGGDSVSGLTPFAPLPAFKRAAHACGRGVV